MKWELLDMGLWLPRSGEEAQAARRAARGRQPRQEEVASAEVAELEAASTRHRRPIVCAGGMEDDDDDEDWPEVRGGTAYYWEGQPGRAVQVDHGVEVDGAVGGEGTDGRR